MKLSYGYICRKTSSKITAFGHSPIEVVHPSFKCRLTRGFPGSTRFTLEDCSPRFLERPARCSLQIRRSLPITGEFP